MHYEKLDDKLNRIENLLDQQTLLQKNVFSVDEAAKYLDISQSHLYKMTSKDEIPHYVPNGKKIYFNREELDKWLLRNRQATTEEIDEQASNYLINNPKQF